MRVGSVGTVHCALSCGTHLALHVQLVKLFFAQAACDRCSRSTLPTPTIKAYCLESTLLRGDAAHCRTTSRLHQLLDPAPRTCQTRVLTFGECPRTNKRLHRANSCLPAGSLAGMAWVLQAVESKGDELPGAARQACFRLAPGSHTLGRKGTAVVLQGDDSISRTHAQATVPDVDSNSVKITGDTRLVSDLNHCICYPIHTGYSYHSYSWPSTLLLGSSDLCLTCSCNADNSRYGTFLNGVRLQQGVVADAKEDDVLQFGHHSRFRCA